MGESESKHTAQLLPEGKEVSSTKTEKDLRGCRDEMGSEVLEAGKQRSWQKQARTERQEVRATSGPGPTWEGREGGWRMPWAG